MEDFAQWLNSQLKKHGMTANGFAQKAGMNSTSIKNYTKGRPVKPDQEKKIRGLFAALENGEDISSEAGPVNINPGNASDYVNPLKDINEELTKRIKVLEEYASELKADKKNLQEQIQRMWNNLGKEKATDQPASASNFTIGKNNGKTGLLVETPIKPLHGSQIVAQNGLFVGKSA